MSRAEQLCEALGPVDVDCEEEELELPGDPGTAEWVGMGPLLAIEYLHDGVPYRHEFPADDPPELLVDAESAQLLLIPLREPVGPGGIEEDA